MNIHTNNNEMIVSICCITYNHENYIRKCLDGFIMQNTNFEYEVLIHDDASTDKTAKIIREFEIRYPKIIKPIYQNENQYSKGVSLSKSFNFPRAQGKYIAMCEGDDYWSDPFKLQNQVDFLETEPNCSMVFTACEILKDSGEKRIIRYPNLKVISPNDYVNNEYFMTTASLMFNYEVLTKAPKEIWMDSSFAGDFILRYRALTIGNIGYIDKITTVYNKGVSGSWSKRKLTKKIILKEFSDNMRGLYFLYKRKNLQKSVVENKVKALKQSIYFKIALANNSKMKGLVYLVYNIKHTSTFYLLSYLKRLCF